METVAMEHNKKIFYLPDKIGDAYPNLIIVRAGNCSITAISRQNFKGLTKLKSVLLHHNQIKEVENGAFKGLIELKNVHLSYNQIEKILSETFEGLKILEILSLGLTTKFNISKKKIFYFSEYNKIKFLNGKAFQSFTNTTVYLNFNVCINQNFTTKFEPSVLSEITEKCGFDEPKPKSEAQSLTKSKQTLVMIIMSSICLIFIIQ
jgi:Leucine-rich repeat (LRR) protein